MRIVLLGPQGAGKGTQAQRLSALIGAQHIATGDMVRAQIRANTALGRAIKGYNDRGAFVPDELMVAMVKPMLKTARSWILDGFPRTLVQARALDTALHEMGVPLDRVVILHTPDDELIVQVDASAPIAAVTEAILRAVDYGCLSSPSASPHALHALVDAAR